MELAEIIPLACTSKDVVNRLRCHNFESIRPILQVLSDAQLSAVISMAFLELGTLRSTPNLDVLYKGKLMEEMIQLGRIRAKVIIFNKEENRIDTELMGYQKYVAQVLLHGDNKVDPLNYEDWLALQPDNLKLKAR